MTAEFNNHIGHICGCGYLMDEVMEKNIWMILTIGVNLMKSPYVYLLQLE